MTGLPSKKGLVRKGFSSDLVPYMVEYVNHLRDVMKRAATMPKPEKQTGPSSPAAIRPDDFFRNQITIRPVKNAKPE